MLWMAWTFNLIQCLDQGILAFRHEGNAKVYRGAARRMTDDPGTFSGRAFQ